MSHGARGGSTERHKLPAGTRERCTFGVPSHSMIPSSRPLLRALLAAAALLAVTAAEASAHGTTLSPASRNYVCRYVDRDSEPCAHAWKTNAQAQYDWMGLLIARADGRHRQLIPDGELCSAGDPKFAAYDRPSSRWLATGIAPGRQTFKWVLNAPHATLYYRFYITKEGHDPTRALRWDDLELFHDSGRRKAAQMKGERQPLPLHGRGEPGVRVERRAEDRNRGPQHRRTIRH